MGEGRRGVGEERDAARHAGRPEGGVPDAQRAIALGGDACAVGRQSDRVDPHPRLLPSSCSARSPPGSMSDARPRLPMTPRRPSARDRTPIGVGGRGWVERGAPSAAYARSSACVATVKERPSRDQTAYLASTSTSRRTRHPTRSISAQRGVSTVWHGTTARVRSGETTRSCALHPSSVSDRSSVPRAASSAWTVAPLASTSTGAPRWAGSTVNTALGETSVRQRTRPSIPWSHTSPSPVPRSSVSPPATATAVVRRVFGTGSQDRSRTRQRWTSPSKGAVSSRSSESQAMAQSPCVDGADALGWGRRDTTAPPMSCNTIWSLRVMAANIQDPSGVPARLRRSSTSRATS